MAGLIGYAKIPLTNINANTLTVVQLAAPTNQRLKLTEFTISFDGTNSANAPGQIYLERQTGGTFTNSSVAPTKLNDPTGTLETLQAVSKNTQTVAPTSGDVLKEFLLPTFGGTIVHPFAPGQEPMVYGGSIVGVRVVSGSQVNCLGGITYEE